MQYLIKILFILCQISLLQAQRGEDLLEVKFQKLKLSNNSYWVVDIQHEEGWHTYWKNPGESGLPIEFKFTQDQQELKLDPLEWPTPKKKLEGGEILTYGYGENQTFFFKSNQLTSQQYQKDLTLEMKWLICKQICIPGRKTFNFKSNGDNWEIPSDLQLNREESVLQEKINHLPKTNSNYPISYSLFKKEENLLVLHFQITGFDLSQFNQKEDLLMPFPHPYLAFKRENLFFDPNTKTLHGYRHIDWEGQYQEPAIPFPSSGQLPTALNLKFLTQKSPHSQVINLELKNILLSGEEKLTKNHAKLIPQNQWDSISSNSSNSATDSTSIWAMLLFAFIGGLILNLMPCVLPVISIKLFSLVNMAHQDRKKIFKHNILYSLGVFSCFFLLALVIILLKSSGQSVGWGFQLQSPTFIILLILILFIFALNLMGLFEFKTPGSKKLGNIQIKDNAWGDFFSGVLATILSTPCSAPFLGTALGFALTSSSLNIFIIFFGIALGLSFPFIMIALIPKSISFLPKPGNWMLGLKKLMAFCLLVTIFWLLDILSSQIDSATIYFFLFPFLLFSFFLCQQLGNPNGSKKILALYSALTIISFGVLYKQVSDNKNNTQSNQNISKTKWKVWTPSKHQELLNNKQLVFIDFTAKWCLTCQFNKKLIFDTKDFKQFTQDQAITLYRADWTNNDPQITDFLKQRNLAGIPVYFLLKDGKEILLGETTSILELKGHLGLK